MMPPFTLPREINVSMDGRVLLFAARRFDLDRHAVRDGACASGHQA